jgi:hypothetical protein
MTNDTYWTSDRIKSELDAMQSRGINRHTVTPLLYRIRDHYEDRIADMPYVEEVKIRMLEEKLDRYQTYIEDLEIQLYGRTRKAKDES